MVTSTSGGQKEAAIKLNNAEAIGMHTDDAAHFFDELCTLLKQADILGGVEMRVKGWRPKNGKDTIGISFGERSDYHLEVCYVRHSASTAKLIWEIYFQGRKDTFIVRKDLEALLAKKTPAILPTEETLPKPEAEKKRAPQAEPPKRSEPAVPPTVKEEAVEACEETLSDLPEVLDEGESKAPEEAPVCEPVDLQAEPGDDSPEEPPEVLDEDEVEVEVPGESEEPERPAFELVMQAALDNGDDQGRLALGFARPFATPDEQEEEINLDPPMPASESPADLEVQEPEVDRPLRRELRAELKQVRHVLTTKRNGRKLLRPRELKQFAAEEKRLKQELRIGGHI